MYRRNVSLVNGGTLGYCTITAVEIFCRRKFFARPCYKCVFFSWPALSVSVVGLERALVQYCSQPNEQPFDIKTVPIETAPSLAEGPRCENNNMT